MINIQKLNRRGYGNRPFRNYPGSVSIVSQSVVEPEVKKLSWFERFINWFKKFV